MCMELSVAICIDFIRVAAYKIPFSLTGLGIFFVYSRKSHKAHPFTESC